MTRTTISRCRLEGMMKKVTAKPKLSFDMDEEDDGADDFQVKKSKESRKFKKMRQAPGIADIVSVEAVVEKTVSQELGGSYSSESLAQLRKAQLFVAQEETKQKVAEDTFESMELSGEAAEEFVELTEQLAMKNSTNLGEYVGFDGSADVQAIHAARLVNKNLIKGSKDSERVYTSALRAPEKKVAFDLAQDNDSDWEEEIIRRGVINKTALSEENKDIAERASKLVSNGSSSSNRAGRSDRGSAHLALNGVSALGEISLADLMRSVQLAVDKLQGSSEAAARRAEQITAEVVQGVGEEAELRGKVEAGVRKLNVAQDIRYFFASLVGMLREKSGSVRELHAVIQASARERLELTRQHRIDQQEDSLLRLKEANLMVSLGNYAPTAVLATHAQLLAGYSSSSGASAEAQVDAFGRVQGSASGGDIRTLLAALRLRESRRYSDRAALVENAPADNYVLGEGDGDLLLTGRLCEVTTEVSRVWTEPAAQAGPSLQELLTRHRALYNSKGEKVEFAQKFGTLSQAARALVEDVQPELLSVANILSRLDQFREAYPAEYQAAYIAESIAELVEPLVSLDLVALSTHLAAGTAGRAVSLKERPWFAALLGYSQRATGDSGNAPGAGGTAPKNSMQSMAAQINSLFEEDERGDEGKETLLSKVADNVLLPWMRESRLDLLDPMSSADCGTLVALVQELQDMCSPRAAKDLLTAVTAHVEVLFKDQLSRISLPLLKLSVPQSREVAKTDDASGTPALARAYTVQQLQTLRTALENMNLFRRQKLLRTEVAARGAWIALTADALPCILKLMRVGTVEDKALVLDICNAVLSLITGADYSRFASRGGKSNNIFDGQLHAWGVQPTLFRPVKAAAEQLNALSAAAQGTPQYPPSEDAFKELAQALNACS